LKATGAVFSRSEKCRAPHLVGIEKRTREEPFIAALKGSWSVRPGGGGINRRRPSWRVDRLARQTGGARQNKQDYLRPAILDPANLWQVAALKADTNP
jgi:hypothetical protein